jgi:predicted AAA+ superfamily ATPase
LGIRNSLIGYKRSDIGKLLENVVLHHLKVCGYEVKTGAMGALEIDFVAVRNEKRLYVQVAYLIPDSNVEDREFGNLLKIPDNYPKIVVSMDEILFSDKQGIEHLHIRKILLKAW